MATSNDDVLKALSAMESRLEAKIDKNHKDVQEQFKGVNSKLSYLMGEAGERIAHGNIVNLAHQHLRMKGVSVLKSVIVPMDISLQGLIEVAKCKGVSKNDYAELQLADIIIVGRKDGESTYSVIEVSEKADEWDVHRAQNRALLLEKAVGCTTIPAVIYGYIEEGPKELAEKNKVSVISYSKLRYE